jgi:DNA-binding transcriptional LysR family regulator
VELRQPRRFPALAGERSITRAANRDLIAQPGPSNPLHAPEREPGTPYARRTRPVRLTAAGELFLELVSAGVGIGFAPAGLRYLVLTAPGSVLRLVPVQGARLERHICLMLPSAGGTSPAARRFADQLLRTHPAGS